MVEITADGTAIGPPLQALSPLLGAPFRDFPVDGLLRQAATRTPDHPAIRSLDGDPRDMGQAPELSYAELDTLADRCAAALSGSVGGPGKVVALGLTLDRWFPVAFFGIVRSGNVAALVNPLLREESLAHVLGLAEAVAVIAAQVVLDRVHSVRDRLPDLRTIIPTDWALPELIAEAPTVVSAPTAAPDSVACLQFTSGTTGEPKAVRLTHRNLVVNAAQTAHAHRVTADSIVFDHLPTFHLMHLTVPVVAGASLVLCPGDDSSAAMAAAAQCKATHFYSLPVRLSRLAADPRLPGLSAPGLRAILSGGSALPAPTGQALQGQFGVPVVQGYGLQETSPSTHFDDLDAPALGSCGYPLAGTECRIVDVDARTPLPVGELGEIQVRGPQVMKGYLGDPEPAVPGPDGWLSTGDIGHLASDGRLFLVDRIGDVFKCDNWLVAPSEIENVLRRHPGVSDCVVVSYPDELSGAVAYGLVVPTRPDLRPAELAAYVADRLPYYQHLRHLGLVSDIPRSPTGKVQRRQIREYVRDLPNPVS